MKNKILVAGIVFSMLALVGCADKEQPIETLKVEKYVTLGDYKGLEATTQEVVVEDEYVDTYLDYVLSQQGELVEVEKVAELGDTVNIDYVGKKDGVPFDGGTGNGYDLGLGSHTFIEGFEDGLVGTKAGDVVDLDLTFPENYGKAELAGQAVVFTVTVNAVKENQGPSIEDYAKDNGYASVEECKADTKKTLMEAQQYSVDTEVEEQLVDQIVTNSSFKELPEWLVNKYYDNVINRYTSYAAQYGMSLEVFANQALGTDMEGLKAQAKDQALNAAKQLLVCEAILRQEGMSIEDADYEEYVTRSGYGSVEDLKKESPEQSREYVLFDKVMRFVMDNANLSVE